MALRHFSKCSIIVRSTFTCENKSTFNWKGNTAKSVNNSPYISKIHKRTLTHYPIDNDLYGLTPEQVQLRETVFKFFQKEIAPIADKIDKEDDFPGMRDFWKKLGEQGLLGITADPKYGGSGMGIFEHCLVLEEFSRVNAAISLSYGAHSNLCVNQINR